MILNLFFLTLSVPTLLGTLLGEQDYKKGQISMYSIVNNGTQFNLI